MKGAALDKLLSSPPFLLQKEGFARVLKTRAFFCWLPFLLAFNNSIKNTALCKQSAWLRTYNNIKTQPNNRTAKTATLGDMAQAFRGWTCRRLRISSYRKVRPIWLCWLPNVLKDIRCG